MLCSITSTMHQVMDLAYGEFGVPCVKLWVGDLAAIG